ncbi:MAG: DUF4277 domain-containing protein [Microcystis sp. M055S1]|nr:DUF4277 domain-containing protein [Microcystis sp. M055S1]
MSWDNFPSKGSWKFSGGVEGNSLLRYISTKERRCKGFERLSADLSAFGKLSIKLKALSCKVFSFIQQTLIINGLDFISKPLYLFPQLFANKPGEELLGEGIKAEEINEHKIGRVMDEIWRYSLEKLWINISLKVVEKYQINTKYSHLDSSSISVEGEYKLVLPNLSCKTISNLYL